MIFERVFESLTQIHKYVDKVSLSHATGRAHWPRSSAGCPPPWSGRTEQQP